MMLALLSDISCLPTLNHYKAVLVRTGSLVRKGVFEETKLDLFL